MKLNLILVHIIGIFYNQIILIYIGVSEEYKLTSILNYVAWM